MRSQTGHRTNHHRLRAENSLRPCGGAGGREHQHVNLSMCVESAWGSVHGEDGDRGRGRCVLRTAAPSPVLWARARVYLVCTTVSNE